MSYTPGPESVFPVDETTLIMLDAACQMNPDSGHTELLTFLSMGEAEPIRKTLLTEEGEGIPVYEIEYPEGQEPWSVHLVIRALIAEIQRLRLAGTG